MILFELLLRLIKKNKIWRLINNMSNYCGKASHDN